MQVGKAERIHQMETKGYPAYITSTGWINLPIDTVRRLTKEAVDSGLTHIKIKVGSDLKHDIDRLTVVREIIGDERKMMVDANQKWGVKQAIEWMHHLAPFKPWWIEEPTSPDDILGHKAVREAMKPYGIGVATGEHCQNRIVFKQLITSDAIDFVQIDSCRLGGVNEVRATHACAARACPQGVHARGTGAFLVCAGAGGDAHGRQVRQARVPARRRRGLVRVRAALVHH